MIDRLFCWIGTHRWEFPGGVCMSCSRPDTLFDSHDEAKIRMRSWRARKR